MIKSLRITNLATIEDIEIEFEEGFSILTGETGAGKSIIIEGIKLVLGEKGSSDVIRTGKKETSIEAIFKLPSRKEKTDQGKELIAQRIISESGTSKSYLDGILVPLKNLKEMGNTLVDIYGQNDHVFLRETEYQLNYLDHFANALPLREEIASLAQRLRKLLREKKELEMKEKERERRLDFLSFQIDEIEKAALKEGEEEILRQERNVLKNAEKIRSLVACALEISYGEEDSLIQRLSKLQTIVDELSQFEPFCQEISKTIEDFRIAIKEFSNFLIKFLEKQDVSEERLEQVEERLSQIEKWKRKYGGSIEEILAYLEEAKKEYTELSLKSEKLSKINQEIEEVFESYTKKAEELSALRRNSASELEKLVEKEIFQLGMKRALFKIKILTTPLDSNELEKVRDTGVDEVEFLISPNPGEELRPLRRIASGGELSRIMLALRSISKEEERHKTLIFDEIDSGIGGKTAEFVAQKLRNLAKKNQVICITHLPQIASSATHHYRIDKKVEKERTYTTVKKLDFEERIQEISHLLSGIRITEATLKTAREMLIHNLELAQE